MTVPTGSPAEHPDMDWQAQARHDHPETSHEAAASVKDLSASQAAVLRVLRQFGPLPDWKLVSTYKIRVARRLDQIARGETVEEDVAWLPRISESGIRSRRAELTKLGLALQVGHSLTPAGRRCRVFDA